MITELLKRIIAALTKKLLLVGAILATWIASSIMPESITMSLAAAILSLNSGYVGREKWLRAYWTGEPPATK
uniref:Uncharacterized protein n=1 Tax=viral metagenome TaxID=1070528 RepID=A0A6H1Z7S7_9ZZZZ